MTNFPINYTYDARNGEEHDGYAATADAALAIIRAREIEGGVESADMTTAVRLTTTEAGSTRRNKDEAAADWAAEIKAGTARLLQVWGGWKVEVSTWVRD